MLKYCSKLSTINVTLHLGSNPNGYIFYDKVQNTLPPNIIFGYLEQKEFKKNAKSRKGIWG